MTSATKLCCPIAPLAHSSHSVAVRVVSAVAVVLTSRTIASKPAEPHQRLRLFERSAFAIMTDDSRRLESAANGTSGGLIIVIDEVGLELASYLGIHAIVPGSGRRTADPREAATGGFSRNLDWSAGRRR